jgi:hypothetical protein
MRRLHKPLGQALVHPAILMSAAPELAHGIELDLQRGDAFLFSALCEFECGPTRCVSGSGLATGTGSFCRRVRPFDFL